MADKSNTPGKRAWASPVFQLPLNSPAKSAFATRPWVNCTANAFPLFCHTSCADASSRATSGSSSPTGKVTLPLRILTLALPPFCVTSNSSCAPCKPGMSTKGLSGCVSRRIANWRTWPLALKLNEASAACCHVALSWLTWPCGCTRDNKARHDWGKGKRWLTCARASKSKRSAFKVPASNPSPRQLARTTPPGQCSPSWVSNTKSWLLISTFPSCHCTPTRPLTRRKANGNRSAPKRASTVSKATSAVTPTGAPFFTSVHTRKAPRPSCKDKPLSIGTHSRSVARLT